MTKVTIQVDVPDEYVDSFKKHVEEIVGSSATRRG